MNRKLKGRTMAELLTRRIAWLNLPPKAEQRLREKVELLFREARIDGIQMAAEVAADYDKLSDHPYLVSQCILGKLNVLRGKPERNPHAAERLRIHKKITEALDKIERRVDSVEATTKFLARTAGLKKKR